MALALALVAAAAPAQLPALASHEAGPAMQLVGTSASSEAAPFACQVRNFVVDDQQLEWAPKEPLLSGKAC